MGRCIAESKTSVAATSITLTYGRDAEGNESHARAAILSYSDVQKYFKQLRRRGYPCRYFVTGEMGSEKGRAHWHGIIFWKKKVPTDQWDYGNNSWNDWKPLDERIKRPMMWNKRFHDPAWPHGFSHWEPVQKGTMRGSIRYVCKYIHKNVDDKASQSKLAMSKMPPLGAEYFEQRAQKFVEEGISPQDRFYQFPNEAAQKDGTPLRFRLAGKSADLFCQHFIDKWRGYPATGFEGPPSCPRGWHYPHSEWLEEYEDRMTRDEWDREAEFAPALKPLERRWPMQPPFGYSDEQIEWDPMAFSPRVKTEAGYLWYGPDEEGRKRAWRSVVHGGIGQTISAKAHALAEPRRTIQSAQEWIEGQEWPEVWTD
ncbi:rolling circle replication-associated protein [Rhizobium brockwellii]|uniref:rolling circle replication-associated protein n=1 Tax=Rhizobium brockwellii TaxID=3019932 RepID=UPI003F9561C3